MASIRTCFRPRSMTSPTSLCAAHISTTTTTYTSRATLSSLIQYSNQPKYFHRSTSTQLHKRLFSTSIIMSTPITQQGHQADPYKEANEDNQVSLQTKVEDLTTFIKSSKFCMMATHEQDTKHIVSRCMALAGMEDNGIDLIFHSNNESGKTDDLASQPDINLGFLTNSGEWASLSGKAEIVSDREQVRKHYSPALKAWLGDLKDGKHDGGPEDPRIVLIKVKVVTAQYATSRRGMIGQAVAMAKGVVQGEVPVINKLRQLSEQEIQQYRSQPKSQA